MTQPFSVGIELGTKLEPILADILKDQHLLLHNVAKPALNSLKLPESVPKTEGGKLLQALTCWPAGKFQLCLCLSAATPSSLFGTLTLTLTLI